MLKQQEARKERLASPWTICAPFMLRHHTGVLVRWGSRVLLRTSLTGCDRSSPTAACTSCSAGRTANGISDSASDHHQMSS